MQLRTAVLFYLNILRAAGGFINSRPGLKIVKKGAAAKWSFSNLAAMVRLHLMTYIDLGSFLRSPEKALMKMFVKSKQDNHHQLLLIT